MSRDEATWTASPPPLHKHAWTRVYRRGGRVAHIWELLISAHPHAPASWDRSEDWYGTGSQAEYERAARMPLCPRCFVMRDRYEEN